MTLDLKIYSLAWTDGDCAVGSAEDERQGPFVPNANLYCIVYLNGYRLTGAISARVKASHDFMEVDLKLSPSSLKTYQCNAEEWERLTKDGVEPYAIEP